MLSYPEAEYIKVGQGDFDGDTIVHFKVPPKLLSIKNKNLRDFKVKRFLKSIRPISSTHTISDITSFDEILERLKPV